jgi:putative DNA primase/helicase
VPEAPLVIEHTLGCASRLYQGKGGRLVITEGVEDALAAHILTGGWPAWAALSAGNMADLELPEQYRELMILADADPAGIEAGKKLAARMMAEGRHVTLGAPSQGKDANDVLRGETSHG